MTSAEVWCRVDAPGLAPFIQFLVQGSFVSVGCLLEEE